MRTTATLDPDVEHLLKNEAHARGRSFKITLNEAVRRAFQSKQGALPKRRKFVVKARSMSLRPSLDPTRLAELADEMETEAFLGLTKRLRRRAR